jgi:outer membrane protein TolC
VLLLLLPVRAATAQDGSQSLPEGQRSPQTLPEGQGSPQSSPEGQSLPQRSPQSSKGESGSGEILTLEQAIALARRANPEVAAAEARARAAAAGVDEALAGRLPALDLAAGIQRTNHPVQVFSHLLAQEKFSEDNFRIEELNRPDPLNDWNTRLTLVQPLWTGGRLRAARDGAQAQAQGAEAGRDRTLQEVTHQAIESYTAAVVAHYQLQVARDALAAAEANVGLTEALWQGGLVVESDALQAQVHESAVREWVIRAESGVAVSRATLNHLLGRNLDTPMTLATSLEIAGDTTPDLEPLLSAAQERPDLAAAQAREEALASAIRGELSSRWPQLAFSSSLDSDDADFFSPDGLHWTVGVGLRLRLFDGGAGRARQLRAQAQLEEAQAQRQRLASAIGLEVRSARQEISAAGQRLRQAEASIHLAERSRTLVEDRYKEGLVRLPELLDAETALTEARLRDVAARRDLLLAQATLRLATGSL